MSHSTVTDLEERLQQLRDQIEAYLDEHLPSPETFPGGETLHEAMRYAALGGKRVRPLLCLLAGEVVEHKLATCLPAACALELFHAYSLVHDDLPAMDDDAERRGRPAVHRQFDEATAILAGDALLTLGFQWLAEEQIRYSPPSQVIAVIQRLCNALGTQGMVGGQYLDLTQSLPGVADVQRMQNLKTGALLSAATEVGALLGGGTNGEVERLAQFGLLLGQTFQLVDDLLDKNQDTRNTSMLKHRSEAQIQQRVHVLNEQACALLDPFRSRAAWLKSLANQLLFRKN